MSRRSSVGRGDLEQVGQTALATAPRDSQDREIGLAGVAQKCRTGAPTGRGDESGPELREVADAADALLHRNDPSPSGVGSEVARRQHAELVALGIGEDLEPRVVGLTNVDLCRAHVE